MNNLIPFQWSIKLDSGEIYVVQTETGDELVLAIEEIKTKFLGKSTPKVEKADIDDSVPFEDTLGEDYCDIHKVKMPEREGKFGKFYSHSTGIYPDMKWCSGKGFGVK